MKKIKIKQLSNNKIFLKKEKKNHLFHCWNKQWKREVESIAFLGLVQQCGHTFKKIQFFLACSSYLSWIVFQIKSCLFFNLFLNHVTTIVIQFNFN